MKKRLHLRLRLSIPFATLLSLVFIITTACSPQPESSTGLSDPNATPEARELYAKLSRISGSHTLFGHHNTLAYGYSWVDELDKSGQPAPFRSDVKDVAGSYPALFGWDAAALFPEDRSEESLKEAYDTQLRYAQESLAGGGVITYSWHMRNPVTGGSFYDKTPAIYAMLPGGEQHESYKADLDRLALFFQDLAPHPIIFRPFHEHNGDWFWWCKPFTNEEEFIQLWRFTQEYMRDEKGLHHLIWAFSPDRSRLPLESLKEDYFWGYPGDDYIDILGLDNYWDLGHKANETSLEQQKKDFVTSLTIMGQLAVEKRKLTALTEAGYETIPNPTWWTDVVLASLGANEWTARSVYFMVWRNANREREQIEHYYAPFPGHPSAPDFIRFAESDRILMENEFRNLE